MHIDSIVALNNGDLIDLALALGLGLLIGVQRAWVQRRDKAGTRFAGIRTFGLFGLAGGMAGVLAPLASAMAAVIAAAAAVLALEGYWRTSRAGANAVSGTSAIVAVLTLGCGFLAGTGARAMASAVAGSIAVLLAMRGPLHRLVRSLDEREVMSIGRFALIALVILPLLPDTPMGPLDAWRPRALWLVVVLVSGFSFAGYLAAKWLGPARGTLATAAAGSLVSSTAVTSAIAGRLSASAGTGASRGTDRLFNAAIALASAVMFVRVMVLTAVLAPFALPTLATGAVPGMIASLAGAALLWRGSAAKATAGAGDAGGAVKLRNPFDLGPAVLMMALVMALTLAARWVLTRYGGQGLAVVLAITGTVDVDSAIITMGSLPGGTLSPRVAGLVLLPPILLNTLFKTGIALALGRRRAWPAAATLLASAGVALLPLVVAI